MKKSLEKMLTGYQSFREKYAVGEGAIMHQLASGQSPNVMIVACCDSRVDPALLLQSDPGELFVVRNVANIIPPFEKDIMHHGTSAALEFGICYLNVKHLVVLGHSQCGGIRAFLHEESIVQQNDFISNWVSLLNIDKKNQHDEDTCARNALLSSYQNALTFPWIKQRVLENKLTLHLWYFDIEEARLFSYSTQTKKFTML